MAKSNKIRWRSIDQKAVTNIARRFNAKITRVMKAHPDWTEILPERINVKELSEKWFDTDVTVKPEGAEDLK